MCVFQGLLNIIDPYNEFCSIPNTIAYHNCIPIMRGPSTATTLTACDSIWDAVAEVVSRNL